MFTSNPRCPNYIKTVLSIGLCALILSLALGCTTSATKDSATQVAASSPAERCAGLQNVIASHPNGFESLKGKWVSSVRLDIWQANFDMVGRSCEVWGWGGGRNDYACSHVFPSKENALNILKSAEKEIASCLADWQKKKSHTARGNGEQLLFSTADRSTKVALFLVPDAISKTRWALHLLVGDTEAY